MKKVLLTISTVFLWLLLDQAHAITLSFDPISAEITQGSGVEVNLVISGLGTGTAPSLGTFDLDVDYDSSLLGVSNVLFADQLDLFGLGSITEWTSSIGSVNLSELSLELPSDLNLLQLDSFTLATLSFDTLGVGSSLLSYSNVILGDADLPVAISPRTGEVILLQMDGHLTFDEFTKAFDLAVKGCHVVSEIQKKALLDKYQSAPEEK